MNQKGHHHQILIDSDLPKIRKALKQQAPHNKKLHLHILRTCTVEPTLPYLKLALADWGIDVNITFSPLQELEEWFEHPTDCDALLVWWRLEDLSSDLLIKQNRFSDKDRAELNSHLLERCLNLFLYIKKWNKAPTYVNTFYLTNWLHPNSIYSNLKNNALELSYQLNYEIAKECSQHKNLNLFPIEQIINLYGQIESLDPKMDLYGKLPIHSSFMGKWAIALASQLKQLTHVCKKVIAVDADNTLWHGILGEDGIYQLKMGVDYPGNIFKYIQHRLLELKSSGILLVLVSKNDQNGVLEVLDKHPDCLLKKDDFIEIICNYEDKEKNLTTIAKSLNLGLDSFAFIDDQPFEREQMRANHPSILVLNSSPNPIEMYLSLYHPELELKQINEEDRERHKLYQDSKKRNVLEESSISRSDFLKSLKLEVTVSNLNKSLIPRAFQMLQKTNQFNLTTKRHLESQLNKWLEEETHCLRMISVKDKFGDQGWVGLMIALQEPSSLKIDSFLLSCRALGREVEEVLWNEAVLFADKNHLTSINAEYIPTARNELVSDFWEKHQLKRTNEKENNIQAFELQLSDTRVRYPDHLTIIKNQ